ncbi:MAG: isocitrate lyase/phosphoenolpyruvate mutase family protein, partial [Exilibacterium sp.]
IEHFGGFFLFRHFRFEIDFDAAAAPGPVHVIVHIEDQVAQKRCGHRPNKEIVTKAEMVDRIKAAVDARGDKDFFIMARTDAFAQEGLEKAVERAQACVEAGADGVFAEAIKEERHYRAFSTALNVPVLANMTEFGQTPLYNKEALAQWGAAIVLYPLSAFRAMNRAAEMVYKSILENGDQNAVVDSMQTRQELYDYLGYHDYENKLDELFAAEKNLASNF